jgi:hypothetical protein
MHRIIIILSILLSFTEHFSAQGSFDMQLLKLERKIVECKSDTERIPFCLQKMDLYIDSSEIGADALTEAKRIDYRMIPDSVVRLRFLWNAALLAHLQKESDLARYYISEFRAQKSDSAAETLLLELLINSDRDTALVTKRISELRKINDSLSCLSCINKVMAYERKHKKAYVVASAVIPGSGSMANGNVGKGAVSLVLNAGVVYAVVALVKNHLIINAVCWGLALGTKFYTGNLMLTSRLVDQKEARKKSKLATDCELAYKKILDKYPLQFR